MTAQRQERNGKIRAAAAGLGVALIVSLAAPGPHLPGFANFPGFAAHATTTERVVINRFSGLAIEGFDPVAYFIDREPVMGSPDFEASQGGAVWRFHNEGNRASFVAHPEIYGPQFGGYDPVDVARGVTFAGNPRFWSIANERLYLFGLEVHRDAFAANPEAFLRQAQARWPKLQQNLAQ
jgi:YHS domain-containing protein